MIMVTASGADFLNPYGDMSNLLASLGHKLKKVELSSESIDDLLNEFGELESAARPCDGSLAGALWHEWMSDTQKRRLAPDESVASLSRSVLGVLWSRLLGDFERFQESDDIEGVAAICFCLGRLDLAIDKGEVAKEFARYRERISQRARKGGLEKRCIPEEYEDAVVAWIDAHLSTGLSRSAACSEVVKEMKDENWCEERGIRLPGANTLMSIYRKHKGPVRKPRKSK